MTVEEAQARVEEIRELSTHSDEGAHSKEDQLYRDVLKAIASGQNISSPADLAQAVLVTEDMEFARWCA
jgi:hypothetical protein